MTDDITDTIAACKRLAALALQGCPVQTYAQLSAVLDKAVALAPQCGAKYLGALQSIIAAILQAQKIDDLLCISDYLGFELPYILEHYQDL